MSLRDFLLQLTEEGRVRVSSRWQDQVDDRARELLVEVERNIRLQLALQPPPFDVEVGAWALATLHAACSFLVNREVESDVVLARLRQPCHAESGPSSCYAADIVLRYLPDLWRLARKRTEKDPLVEGIQRLGSAWPLSSVGMGGIDKVDVTPFIENRCLRILYVDRIITWDDQSRLFERRVREALNEAIGDHSELARSLLDRSDG